MVTIVLLRDEIMVERQYEVIIDNINKLSENYIIPSKFTPLKIQLQDEKFYEGWRALIRE